PQEAVALADVDRLLSARSGLERVARVRPPDVGADRATEAVRVDRLVAEVVRLGQGRIVPLRGQRQRGAARPAADHLRGQPRPRRRVAGAVRTARRGVDEAPEARHVLPQLSEDQVAAVLAEVGPAVAVGAPRELAARVPRRLDRRPVGDLAVLVPVAEEELARLDRVQRRARPARAGDQRLRDAVTEAEVLARAEVDRLELRELDQAAGGGAALVG